LLVAEAEKKPITQCDPLFAKDLFTRVNINQATRFRTGFRLSSGNSHKTLIQGRETNVPVTFGKYLDGRNAITENAT